MFKLDLEKVEEQEIKLPTLLDHRKSQRVPERHLLLLSAFINFINKANVFDCVDQKQNKTKKKNWKILQEMGILDHFTCLLRNLFTGQEATVRTGHGTTD